MTQSPPSSHIVQLVQQTGYPADIQHSIALSDPRHDALFDFARWRREMRALSARFSDQKQQYDAIVVVGTGGSTLGARMLKAFRPHSAPPLYFMENTDPSSIREILQALEGKRPLCFLISKSGSTLETLCLSTLLMEHLAAQKLPVSKHCIAISDPKPSALRTLVSAHQIPVLDHPAEIGGRFSVFTLVGLLPIWFAGVNVDDFLTGAEEAYLAFQKNPDATYTMRSTHWNLAQRKAGKTISVLMPYATPLREYTYWWRQIWAESLGKNGHFTTPFVALGSVDQHSQLQEWLDGIQNKSFTLLTVQSTEDYSVSVEGYTAPISLAGLTELLAQSTLESLKRKHIPLQHLHAGAFSPTMLGHLVTHHMLEVLLLASALSIDPYDQPEVEFGKQYVRDAL